jgi:DNA invertase Pin-like site-specific DNA recombinase
MQDCDRQVNQLKDLAFRKGWKVDAVFREKGSGTKRNSNRKELVRMIEYLQTHHIDKVLVTESNKLARNPQQSFEIIGLFNKLGVSLYVQNGDIETLKGDCKVNPVSMLLINIMTEVDRLETKVFVERIKEGRKSSQLRMSTCIVNPPAQNQ